MDNIEQLDFEQYRAIKPTDDKVVLKQIDIDEESSNGILMPSALDNNKWAVIVAVGEGQINYNNPISDNGKLIRLPMALSIGDIVVYSNSHGIRFKFKDEELIAQKQSDIIVKIEK